MGRAFAVRDGSDGGVSGYGDSMGAESRDEAVLRFI